MWISNRAIAESERRRAAELDHACRDYFCFVGSLAGVEGTGRLSAGAARIAGTGGGLNISRISGESLSARASKALTCQICWSVRDSLNPGIPVRRIPFFTFQ